MKRITAEEVLAAYREAGKKPLEIGESGYGSEPLNVLASVGCGYAGVVREQLVEAGYDPDYLLGFRRGAAGDPLGPTERDGLRDATNVHLVRDEEAYEAGHGDGLAAHEALEPFYAKPALRVA